MNTDPELGKTSDAIEENEVNPSFLGDVGASFNAEGSLNLGASDESRASPMVLDSVPADSEGVDDGFRGSENERSEEVKARDCKWAEEDINKEMKSRVSELKTESEMDSDVKNERFDDQSQVSVQFDEFGAEDESNDQMGLKFDRKAVPEKCAASDYKSLLSEFDDYVASEKMDTGVSRALSYGFEVGDMVWGKVKSHPWWPGHIFNEAFASSSVRRTRRAGSVLVAFFGDSSYGWFDPAEIIPFEPHFAEKSQQTNSRNFVRAVEEAMDEASRRSALGLACKCRNPYNFRPTSAQGYYAVDVPDYEPQAVYSADQIKKARDSFGPSETLSFLKLLALAPQECDLKGIKFLKNKAAVFAFRKAVFEEFDETYAQAFGVQSLHPSVNSLDQYSRAPRAPLSGPLVIAEALGDGKSLKKPIKVKDGSKHDKYLFKRRDEADGSRTVRFSQVQVISSASPRNNLSESSAGDYVLQRRAPSFQTPVKDDQSGFVDKDAANSSGDVSGKESIDARLSIDKGKGIMQESKERPGQNAAITRGQGEAEAMLSPKYEGSGNFSRSDEAFQQSGHSSSTEVKKSAVSVIKKVKVPKRTSEDMGIESSALELKKKKKKKKETGLEPNFDSSQQQMNVVSGKGGPVAGTIHKKMKAAQLKLRKRVDGSTTVNMRHIDLEVPILLSGLHAFALDPFFGADKNAAVIMRQFFLKFRSLVYQKSLGLSPPSDTEFVEGHAMRSTTAENARDVKPSKSFKALNKSDDPTKSGKKRLPSDRQEENAVKKLKKIKQMKSMASEKKAGQRNSQALKTEEKEQTGVGPTTAKPEKEQSGFGPTPVKPVKAPKKTERPPSKVVEPTMLVMKFPPGTSLPSAAQLKARFGRFGLLDQSAIRVFWKSSTCRVVFLYKTDAQTAYRYSTGNNSLFGNVNVRYFLRDVEAPGGEGQESQKGKGDDGTGDSMRMKEPVSEYPSHVGPTHQPILQAPPVQLKSCLKKASGDDNSNGNGRRVKFMLGGEETSSRVTEQFMVSSSGNKFNNTTTKSGDFTGAGGSPSSSSSVAMDFSSKNFANIVPTSSMLPPQYANPQPINNLDHLEAPPPRNFHNVKSSQSAAPSSADISQQMLSLLTRCNDVVANVTGLLGYVPYHPL